MSSNWFNVFLVLLSVVGLLYLLVVEAKKKFKQLTRLTDPPRVQEPTQELEPLKEKSPYDTPTQRSFAQLYSEVMGIDASALKEYPD